MKYVRGYVYVQLTGYAPERFLNLCGSRDILIWNLTPYGEGYRFCISVEGFRSLKPILKKTRTKIRIIRRCGMPFHAHRYRKRKVFAVGIFLFSALLYYMSGFIWNIEVNGNSYLSEEVILDFLKEEGSSFGAKKTRVDCARLEEALRSRYSEVIWTSVKIYGTKMTVDIQENLLPEEDYQKKEDTVCDIIASKDGVIQDIVTRSGTPLVAAGDEVKAGDILVSGSLEIRNDSGEVSGYLYESADADITAEVSYSYEDVIEADYIDETPTGNTKTDYSIRIFGAAFANPFFKHGFEHCSVVSDTSQLRFTDNFYLPVSLTRKTYQEYQKTKKTHSEKEIRQIATKNLRNYLADLEEKGIQIIGKNVMIVKKNNKYVAGGTIDACESIVSYQPARIYQTTGEEGRETDESD